MKQERRLNPDEMHKLQNSILVSQKEEANKHYEKKAAEIRAESNRTLQRAIDLASIKGASTWLTARPLLKFSTVLPKSDFRDALYLRYGWEPRGLPAICGCGSSFNVEHAMQCMTGGYRGLMHNEVMSCFYRFMKEAGYKDVTWEPLLQPLHGEEKAFQFQTANKEEEARSDIRVTGFWSRLRRAFFDITAFSPYAPSNQQKPLSLFRKSEKRKYREYGERIREVEHGDFTPLVFSTSGGMGPQAEMVIKRIGMQLAEQQNLTPSVTISWIRCRLSFAILRSSLVCLRGSRPLKKMYEEAVELSVNETDFERS